MLTSTADSLNLTLFAPETGDTQPDNEGEWVIKTNGDGSLPSRYSAHGIVSEARYIKPPLMPDIPDRYLCYDKADDLVATVEVSPGSRHFVVVSGNFIFGDFIEALLVAKQWQCKTMTISTLSLSEANIDSLRNLIEGEFVLELNLIVSDYWFSNERFQLVPYAYECLDVNNCFQLAVANTHCKLCSFETTCGKLITIHGSANMRSSGSIEQFAIEWNDELYAFNAAFQNTLLERYKTINKLPLAAIAEATAAGQPIPGKALKEIKRDSKPKAWHQAAENTRQSISTGLN